MWRGWFVLMIGLLVACLPAAASAAPLERTKEPVSRIGHLAAELRRDPVYVTDHSPRALQPDAAQRIKAAVARLGTPTYVVVTPTLLSADGHDPEDLATLLHDTLNRPGLYIVADPSRSSAAALQYGGTPLPAKEAMRATTYELPSDAGAVARIELFVDNALAGPAEMRKRQGPTGERPKTRTRIALDERERSERRARTLEWSAFAGASALTGIPILLVLIMARRRRTAANRPPPARNRKVDLSKTQAKNTRAKRSGGGGRRGRR